MVSVVIAVGRATKANGCLQVIKGAHKYGRIEHGHFGTQTGADPKRVDLLLENLERVYCEMEQGDVLFFTGRIGGDGDRDGLPNVIPEAMAAGLVVITSPSAGAAEAVTDGETGFVLDPFKPDAWVDLVARLVREPSLVHSVGVTAAKVARRRFDARRNIAELWRRIIRACPIREEEE